MDNINISQEMNLTLKERGIMKILGTMKNLDLIVAVLLVIGGLNWAFIGVFQYNFIDSIFGMNSVISRIIYILVGISAIYQIIFWKKIQRHWKGRK